MNTTLGQLINEIGQSKSIQDAYGISIAEALEALYSIERSRGKLEDLPLYRLHDQQLMAGPAGHGTYYPLTSLGALNLHNLIGSLKNAALNGALYLAIAETLTPEQLMFANLPIGISVRRRSVRPPFSFGTPFGVPNGASFGVPSGVGFGSPNGTPFGAPNWPEFKSPWTPGTFVCPRSGLISNILELVDSDAARASKYISFESTDTEVDFDAIDPSQILNLQFDIGYSATDLDRILIYSATDLERILIEGEPLTVESFRMLLKLAAADGMTHLRTDRIYSQPEEPTSVILHPNLRIDNALRQLSNKDDSTAVKFKGESRSVIGGSTFTIAEVKSDDSGSSINGIPLTAGVLRILLQNAHINGYAHATFKFMR